MNHLKRILVADDNAKDVELTLAALEEYHLTNDVIVVGDGAQVLDYLKREGSFKDRTEGNPAVILLDLKMPKVDGLEVLREIKSDERFNMVPVVMLTSSREEGGLIASYKLGVNAYVVKPVNFGEFVNAVKGLGVFWAIVNEPPPGTTGKKA